MNTNPNRQRRATHKKRKVAAISIEAQVAIAKLKASTSRNWGEDRTSHHLMVIKKPPQEVEELRKRLEQPQHADIRARTIANVTFADCLGEIASCLDIILDGEYDVPDLCGILVRAMDARGTLGNNPASIDSKLVPAELHERKNSVEIIEQTAQMIAPMNQFDMTKFMKDHNCTQCDNTAACRTAGKCLGDYALAAVVDEAGKVH